MIDAILLSKVCLIVCTVGVYIIVTAILGYIVAVFVTDPEYKDETTIITAMYIVGACIFIALFITYLRTINFI